MQDLKFSTPAKRDKFLKSIAKHKARIAAKQGDLFARPLLENSKGRCVTTPPALGVTVGHPSTSKATA